MRNGSCSIFLLRIIGFSTIVHPTSLLFADELVLINGDTLKGQTVKQTNRHLIWHSDNFGDLSIALEEIASINGAPLSSVAPLTGLAATVSSFNNSYIRWALYHWCLCQR